MTTPARITVPGAWPGWAAPAFQALIVFLAVVLARSSPFEALELRAYDRMQRAHHAAASSPTTGSLVRLLPKTDQLVIVEVDDRTASSFPERLPMARSRLARFVDTATAAGARVVVLDYFLHGKSSDAKEDETLRTSFENSKRVILAKRWLKHGDGIGSLPNDPYFAQSLLGEASILFLLDHDSIVRRYHLQYRSDDRNLPSMGMLSVIHQLGLKTTQVEHFPESDEVLVYHAPEHDPTREKIRIPLAPGDSLYLSFAGGLPFRTVPYIDLEATLEDEPDLLKDKIVLMGTTALYSNDWHHVPVSPMKRPDIPGVYIHGYAIRDILNGTSIERATGLVDRSLVLLIGIASATLLLRATPSGMLVTFILSILLIPLLSLASFCVKGYWITTVFPLMEVSAMFLAALWIRLQEEKQARLCAEGLVGRFFSPSAQAGLENMAADSLESANVLLAPEKFEIVSKLGQGGMSVVFRAVQQPMGRAVALKFISPKLYQDGDARQRFLREARIAGSLIHPNLVTVFDSGESRGVPFIAMELMEGESLKSMVEREGRLPPDRAVTILREVLKGLEYIHGRGIIHRDIKSENILLSLAGVVKITDFGIAKSSEDDPYQTMQQVILGTPAYISPEQIRGERLTPASDIYSLGIVLYEMLVGHPPFLGSSSGKILVMHINNRPPDPLESGVELPRRLAAIMDRSLVKDPAERYQSAREMLDELALVGTETVSIGEVQTGTATHSKTATIGIRTGSGSGTLNIRSTRDLNE